MNARLKPARSLVRAAQSHAEVALCRLLYPLFMARFRQSLKRGCRKLHVGCGRNRFQDWINSDVSLSSELIIFLEKRLPFVDDHLDRIYSEHVLEHVPYPIGVSFLRESYRVLRPGGIIRISMPDLDYVIESYLTDWRRQDWVNWPQFAFIQTRAEMINIAFRWWGHRHLYNREELARAFSAAGFHQFRFMEWGESDHSDLRGLETRLDSRLIAEAVKSPL